MADLVTFTEEILNWKLYFLSFMTMQWNAEGDEILLILFLSNGGYKCLFCIINLSLTLQYLTATGNYLKLSYSYLKLCFK